MSKSQCKNTINNRKDKMSEIKFSYSTTARPEHPTTAESQKKDLQKTSWE